MSNWEGDLVADGSALTEGTGVVNRGEDLVIDNKANSFVNSELSNLEGDVGLVSSYHDCVLRRRSEADMFAIALGQHR